MTATLTRFRVKQFRSVVDSGWITTDEITALIGTNESGKTNLLMALWKLKPAKSGAIDLIADLPRKDYHSLRDVEEKPVFIQADFGLDDEVVDKICRITGAEPAAVRTVRASRSFDGSLTIGFPDYSPTRSLPTAEVGAILHELRDTTSSATELKGESGLKQDILTLSDKLEAEVQDLKRVTKAELDTLSGRLSRAIPSQPMKTSALVPAVRRAVKKLADVQSNLNRKSPSSFADARDAAWSAIPSIIYYSTYGNLDSEIYLPHVIENLKRDDLGEKEEAKARTLKVLFEFVRLSPGEILSLGREAKKTEDDDELAEVATRKKEREILLQSASTDLTGRFRTWWRQGDYQFRFQADGNHFRIWVSDDRRPEQIELEGRSSGMQWFFSFYLVFLVEAEDSHADALLLLDEPGLSLHPLSQQDLSDFFKGLAGKNQLIYTTHSPFMVDADHLDRVKAVFIREDGTTAVSADLRSAPSDESRIHSIYPVHAALGLSVSQALLLGCQAVVVEGASDQIYLSAIKNLLIRSGNLKPPRELVFMPAGGVKGVKAIASILSSRDDDLPVVVLDSDDAGVQFAKHLVSGLYAGKEERVVMIGDHFKGIAGPEVEDLFPTDLWAYEVTRYLRGPEEEFDEVVDGDQPVCDQVEHYAKKHGLALEIPGWKVELAERVKKRLLKAPESLSLESAEGKAWKAIFKKATTLL